MKKDQLRKNRGYRVKLRPMAHRYEGRIETEKELVPVDDDWLIVDVKDKGIEIENVRTDHSTILGYDHIREFLSDPDRDRDGMKHGFLVLKVQIHISGIHLQIGPIFN